MSLTDKLERTVARHDEVRSLVTEHPDPASSEYAALLKEYSDLTELVERVAALHKAERELADVEALKGDPDTDAEMSALAESEGAELRKKISDLGQGIRLLLLPRDEADDRNVILELRAGTGGDEAALFAAQLYRMYQRYAELHGWRFEPISISDTGIGGYKDASAAISGKGVFARLKFESGTHRVQRVPVTESGGRIHTSAATVAVLPEAEEVEVKIEDKELRVDTFRSQGAGGQHVNTTDSAVRITHLPSGIVVSCQDEKSQHKNRAKAMKVLRARLFEQQREEAAAERAESRRLQVGSGDRSEKIRTYNFREGRVTDHRIKLTLYKLEQVMTGEALDEVIEALLAEDQAARLAESQ
ncbi:MAG: peptide chain release factor 1 [Rhodospirillales bacterium]|nr:peptide chain release factor 1 [Rhodospirillales bacterium]